MGAAFVSQQYLQNVLGYSTLEAGAAFLPAVFCMVLVAPRSAKLVEARGARFTLLCGYVFLLLAFATMLLVWKEDSSYWEIFLAYALIGVGVGFAGTPASHSLTSSVPVRRAGMASGTADLQRDLGGAIMQSIFGALLTAGYASAAGALISSSGKDVTDSTQAELTKSFSSAANTASSYPASVQDNIIAGARTAFLHGDQWAYIAGILAILLGAVLASSSSRGSRKSASFSSGTMPKTRQVRRDPRSVSRYRRRPAPRKPGCGRRERDRDRQTTGCEYSGAGRVALRKVPRRIHNASPESTQRRHVGTTLPGGPTRAISTWNTPSGP